MSDDENDSVHTPTQSEFATFEILANRDYTNMSKRKPRSKDLRGSFPVDVVEEEEDDQDQSRDEYEEEEAQPKEFEENENDDGERRGEKDDERGSVASRKSKSESETSENDNDHDRVSPNKDDRESAPPSPQKMPSQQTPAQQSDYFRSIPPPLPKVKKPYIESIESERRDEKEGLLTELLSLAESGQCKLVRTLTMKDSLEEISFQYDRCQSEIEARRMVNLAKSSIDVGAGVIEMVAKNFGFGLLDGYHKSLCSDMNRFDRPLTKIYKKYWRRGSQKPEMELAMIIIGSFGWTVMSNMMKDGSYLKKFFGGKGSKSKEDELKEKDKEMEALKAKFSSTSNVSTTNTSGTTPPSPANSSGGKRTMRPPSSSMNLASPWVQVSSTPKIDVIEEPQPKAEIIDRETASALQSLKLKEIEMEKRMERLAKMEEEFSKKLNSVDLRPQPQPQKRGKTLSELASSDVEVFTKDEDDEEEEEHEEDDDEKPEPEPDTRRVVVISSPPASGRKSGRKTGHKPPVVKL